METMIKNAQKSVTIVTSSKGLIRKLETLKPCLEKLNKKGVKIRIAANITKENKSYVKDISKIAEVKNMNKPESRFVIVDGADMMFMVMSDEEVHPTYDLGVWINTPFFAQALSQLFDMAWKDMKKV